MSQRLNVNTFANLSGRNVLSFTGNNLTIGDANFPATSMTYPALQNGSSAKTFQNLTVGNRLTCQSVLRVNTRIELGANSRCVMDFGASTDACLLPRGTEGQRPSAENGVMRYRSDNNTVEAYVNNTWTPVQFL